MSTSERGPNEPLQPERPTASLLGTRRAARAGARLSGALGTNETNVTADSTSKQTPAGLSSSTEEARYVYETLLKCRELELNLHVGRSNLCLVIEAALLAFVGTLITSDATDADKWLLLLMTSVFGLVFSAVSISVVQGADFWVGYWEHRLAQSEPEACR